MQNDDRRDWVLTDYAKRLIRFKARQICRRPGFSRSDREDVQQELWEAVVRKAHLFDPERSSLDTFIDRVVGCGIRMLLRDRRRRKRANGFHTRSLDEQVRHGDRGAESLSAGVGDDDRGRHRGSLPEDKIERREAADAVEHALRSMPTHVRDVCRLVMGGSISSAARDLGVSRRQIRNALDEARAYFERAGFGDA